MKRLLLFVFLATALHAAADWREITAGVDYQRITRGTLDVHVARIDLTNEELRLVTTTKAENGLTVSEFAKQTGAIIAINADYFDKDNRPIGMAAGACGVWAEAQATRKEPVVMVGARRAEIAPAGMVPEDWVTGVVAGWPTLISSCKPLETIAGSSFFTLSPHPRTAVALSEDGQTLYMVVADGRREGVPGPTLPELATFLREEFGVCEALNLDGGGSTAMWVEDAIVNTPSDGFERFVGNHLAVIPASAYEGCVERERLAKE